MNKRHRHRLLTGCLLLSVVALASGVLLTNSAAADPSAYAAVDLGTLGGSRSFALAISDNDQAVGYSYTEADTYATRHAFSWTAEGGMVDLGTLGGDYSWAWAVRDSGQVVGYSETAAGFQHAFSWTEEGGMVDLGTLTGFWSSAVDVNEAGQVWAPERTPSCGPRTRDSLPWARSADR